MNTLHGPLKWTNKYKLNFKTKPWITPVIQKIHKWFINAKDSLTKKTFHRHYKDYRNNMLSTLFKKSKANYCNQYLKANMNNIKNLMD